MDNTAHNIDTETFNELQDILGNELIGIVNEFYNDASGLIDSLKGHVNNQSKTDLINIAHSLKGSAGNIGLKTLFASCNHLENSLRQDTDIDLTAAVDDISSSYNSCVSELKKMGY